MNVSTPTATPDFRQGGFAVDLLRESVQNFHPGGAGGHAGSGVQFGPGWKPADTCQPGGGLNDAGLGVIVTGAWVRCSSTTGPVVPLSIPMRD